MHACRRARRGRLEFPHLSELLLHFPLLGLNVLLRKVLKAEQWLVVLPFLTPCARPLVSKRLRHELREGTHTRSLPRLKVFLHVTPARLLELASSHLPMLSSRACARGK